MASKATPPDDPVARWNERIAPLRKRGRRSAIAASTAPTGEVDIRRGRPPAPERLNPDERALWDQLMLAKRPGWFTGAEALLESYIITLTELQRIEALLRAADPEAVADDDDDESVASYHRLARTRNRFVTEAAMLATKLRLTPQTRIDKTQPHAGEESVAA